MTATATPPTITMIGTSDLVSFQNIRAADRDITELAASLTRVGVLEPLIVAPDQIDQTPNSTSVHAQRWVVVAGNRRLAAAKKAKIAAVPCIIRTDLGSDLRIIETQLAENLQRDPLTLKEETIAFQKLELAGMTATDIGKVAGRKKTQVDARLKLLDLPETTRGKVWDGQITLDEADVLASFANDPEAVAWLEKYVGTSSFAWRQKSWKYEKETRAKAALVKAEKDAEKTKQREAAKAAKAAGKPLPKPAAPKKDKWQIDQEKAAARRQVVEEAAATAAEIRLPWIRDVIQTEAKAKVILPKRIRGIINMALNTDECDADLWAWLGLPQDDTLFAEHLTDAQALLMLAAMHSDATEDFPRAWDWSRDDRGPALMNALVTYLDYPISPEEQALANGDVS
jgi:ParB/RepB/Spo0J family partition protein